VIASSLRDATERQRTRDLMVQARIDAEEASRLKSAFLATMSHEIRTPMNAIIGFSHLVLTTELNDKQRHFIQRIDTAGKNLLNILNDILDYYRIESGQLAIEKVAFTIPAVLKQVQGMLQEKIADKGLQMRVEVADNVPAELLGDPLRIGQILLNYCTNAVKFTHSGSIDVRVDALQRSVDTALLKFTVTDTGMGLDTVRTRALFKPFHQGDSSPTRKYGVTGLGLAICKTLAELMGGEVGVQSALGEGSAFWFTVQAAHGAPTGNTGLLRALR
jgi:two-component system sensor histidine kinase/response regulator